jgi:molybdopterin-containing oxidoreductase family membrane subunit
MYYPTWVDFSLLFGTVGFFSTLFLLFLKFIPAVAVSEVKELRHELAHGHYFAHPALAKRGTPSEVA